ncbi:hypothetical protein [Sphingopyxis indica]|uniref:hypothetical protein n=1 Tax=Sphingopyxis indica TaxID=436663 RepID=UPI001481DB87|nr:hypothetical protein [Sphingopyxis indica]
MFDARNSLNQPAAQAADRNRQGAGERLSRNKREKIKAGATMPRRKTKGDLR